MEKDNLTKLIDNLLEENKELKEKVRQLENENNLLKMDKVVVPNQPVDPWYNKNPKVIWVYPNLVEYPTYPTDAYGAPVPYCSSSTTVESCL